MQFLNSLLSDVAESFNNLRDEINKAGYAKAAEEYFYYTYSCLVDLAFLLRKHAVEWVREAFIKSQSFFRNPLLYYFQKFRSC